MELVPNSHVMGQQGLDPANPLTEKQQVVQMRDNDIIDRELSAIASYTADRPVTINTQPLEVYMYYAAIEREREDNDTRPVPDGPWGVLIKTLTGRKDKICSVDTPNYDAPMPSHIDAEREASPSRTGNEKKRKASDGATLVGTGPVDAASQSERRLAYRALRTASWQAVFYLM